MNLYNRIKEVYMTRDWRTHWRLLMKKFFWASSSRSRLDSASCSRSSLFSSSASDFKDFTSSTRCRICALKREKLESVLGFLGKVGNVKDRSLPVLPGIQPAVFPFLTRGVIIVLDILLRSASFHSHSSAFRARRVPALGFLKLDN